MMRGNHKRNIEKDYNCIESNKKHESGFKKKKKKLGQKQTITGMISTGC